MPNNAIGRITLSDSEFWQQYGRDEGATLDFKEQLPKPAKLQEPVVAFANTRGGTVAVGVSKSPPRRIIGVGWDQASEERLQETARMTQPPVTIASECIDVDGKPVALLRVEPVSPGWVHTSDGRLIVRAGPTNRTLVGLELARFVAERSEEPIEDRSVPSVAFTDLQTTLLRRYVSRRLGRQRVNLEHAARDLNLITQAGKIRLATVLLFGKEPQRQNRRFGIEVLRFEGSASRRPLLRDRRELTGTLPELVDQADRVIYEEMRRDAVIRGLVREEVPEFPPLALREALVNAVGHRDYSLRGSTVQVRLFDDAIEIESPGTLAGWVTLENLLTAQYSRNERIMAAFHVLGFVEEAGTGIDRMLTAMEDALLDPPEFEERSNSFLVRFRGRSVFAAEDRVWVSRFAHLSLGAHEKVALVYARRHATVTNEELRVLRGLDTREARDVLRSLVALRLLQPHGRGRGTRYRLGDLAREAGRGPNPGEQLHAVVAHARRVGSVANRDVRGLLGVDRVTARATLELGVAQDLLEPIGERRARRYLPTPRAEEVAALEGEQ